MESPASAPTDNRQLILALIKDDLINSKLINNLNDMGIDASNYSLNLRLAIMKLMGFGPVNDQTHEKYTDLALGSKYINFLEQAQLLDPLALEIYSFLDGLNRKAVETEKPFVSNRAIVTNLIKQDLINWKMVNSLGSIQISADDYQLDISKTIFEIMDLEEREDVDDVFEKYVELSKPMLELHASQSNQEIDILASKIYDYLEKCSQK